MSVCELGLSPRLPRIDRMMPVRLDCAVFGMEHFFGFEPRFGVIKGVWRTAVGYSGGRCENPSRENPGDHMEAVLVEYDPVTLSYGQLLDIFLNRCGCREGFSSASGAVKRASCVSRVFVKSEFERRLAQAAISRYELRFGAEGCVRVGMYRTFYQAEACCQKYFLRMLPKLMEELMRMYPDEDRLIQSTLATRLNGMLGMLPSFRESRIVPEDFEFYDLSECAADIVKNMLDLSGSKLEA